MWACSVHSNFHWDKGYSITSCGYVSYEYPVHDGNWPIRCIKIRFMQRILLTPYQIWSYVVFHNIIPRKELCKNPFLCTFAALSLPYRDGFDHLANDLGHGFAFDLGFRPDDEAVAQDA